jgi:UDP-N-acetylmuramoyl-tripeptide--D-alanyl-D-alanine ligase
MNAPLWTQQSLQEATGGQVHGTIGLVTGVSIDTRTLAAGDVFVALEGDKSDGHEYVRLAFEKGAAAALVRTDRAEDLAEAGPLLAVPDVLEGLCQIGRAARARSDAKIAAVTGSVGKTGTKEALRLVLSQQAETHASVASYNNHFGVPLTLARMAESADFGVFEIGMNHAGEIAPLAAMVKPHVALITTVEAVHIEFFPSVEAIADEKSALFSGLLPGGTAVINRDNPHFERMQAAAKASPAGRIVSFGSHHTADIRLVDVALLPDASLVTADCFGRRITYRLGSPGRHIAMNSLGILGVVDALGADVSQAAQAMDQVMPPSGRGARVMLGEPGQEITLLDESYNANPAAVRAALSILASTPVGDKGRRVAVLGDMRELGQHADALHAGLAPDIVAQKVDLLFACGPHMKALWSEVPDALRGAWAPDSASLESLFLDAVRPGDTVMIKGSLGSRMGPLVAALKAKFAKGNA